MALFEARVGTRGGLCRSFRWACLLACMGAGGGCTELAAGEDTLGQTESPNLPPVMPGDPRWACLDEPAPASAVPLRPQVDLALVVTDTGTNQPPAGVALRACRRLDEPCADPAGTATEVALDGALHLSLEPGFDGYVEITSPSTVSMMFYLNRELWVDSRETLGLVSPAGLAGLERATGATLDPERGHLLMRAFDCAGAPASGVELSNNKGGEPFVFVGGLPMRDLAVTADGGVGGFINVPPGFVALQGVSVESSVESDRLVGTTSVAVRKNWFTWGDIEPAATP